MTKKNRNSSPESYPFEIEIHKSINRVPKSPLLSLAGESSENFHPVTVEYPGLHPSHPLSTTSAQIIRSPCTTPSPHLHPSAQRFRVYGSTRLCARTDRSSSPATPHTVAHPLSSRVTTHAWYIERSAVFVERRYMHVCMYICMYGPSTYISVALSIILPMWNFPLTPALPTRRRDAWYRARYRRYIAALPSLLSPPTVPTDYPQERRIEATENPDAPQPTFDCFIGLRLFYWSGWGGSF